MPLCLLAWLLRRRGAHGVEPATSLARRHAALEARASDSCVACSVSLQLRFTGVAVALWLWLWLWSARRSELPNTKRALGRACRRCMRQMLLLRGRGQHHEQIPARARTGGRNSA